MKLVQKQFLKGSSEFEIVDDSVNIRIRSLLREEKISVILAILNPEPVVNPPLLEFHSRVKCGPLLSLRIDEPNATAFNVFVDQLKQRIQQEYNAFAGFKSTSAPQGLNGNVYDEPPEFDETGKNRNKVNTKPIRIDSLDETIQMLNQYLDSDDIKPLLAALETLREHPESPQSFEQLANAFDNLGPLQGAVLTYAPYVSILLADDPLGN